MESEIKIPLPWQQKIWQRLTENAQLDRIAHALLLVGPEGLGKHLFATALANTLLCRQPTEAGACGQCKDCQLLKVGNHPDFRFVSLEEKAQAIKIDQIRALVVALAKTPQISRRHCVIIEPADCLNTAAANALLKLLEEPQGDAVLILISAHPNRLPATIRSRCQQSHFSIPETAMALSWLQGQISSEAETYLSLAKGAPLKALQLQTEGGLEAYQALGEQLEGVLLGQASLIDVAANYAARPGTEVADVMLNWLQLLAQNRVLGPGSISASEPIAEGSALGQLSANGSLLALYRFYDKLLATKSLLISSANPNKTLLWEECLLDWIALFKTVSIAKTA